MERTARTYDVLVVDPPAAYGTALTRGRTEFAPAAAGCNACQTASWSASIMLAR